MSGTKRCPGCDVIFHNWLAGTRLVSILSRRHKSSMVSKFKVVPRPPIADSRGPRYGVGTGQTLTLYRATLSRVPIGAL